MVQEHDKDGDDMPDLTRELIYNNGTDDTIAKYGTFIGGSEQYIYGRVYSGIENRMEQLGQVMQIDVSDLDNTVHNSRANARLYPILEFSNGCKLMLSVYCESITYDGDTRVCVDVEGCIVAPNGDKYYGTGSGGTADHRIDYLARMSSISNNYYTLALAKVYGLRVFMTTDYAYGKGDSVPGTTKASYFEIKCCIPYTNKNNLAGQQSWYHMSTGALKFYTQNTGSHSTWISNPQYIWYGYNEGLSGIGNILYTDDLTRMDTLLNAISPLPGPSFEVGSTNDPNQELDPSGPGGGAGNMDPTSDPIPFPDLPIGGALDSGSIKAFKVDKTIMRAVFQRLWSTALFDISTFQKLVESPLSALISLQCVPITVTEAGTEHIMLGNYDTEQNAKVISQEYYQVDAGTLTVNEYWGSALDYEPYTKYEIFVPFCGIKHLSADDIVGKTLNLRYNYSIFDGNMTAQLMCGNAVLYKWPCNVIETIPVTAAVKDALQKLVSGGATTLMGAAGGIAGIAAGAISSAINVVMSKTQIERAGTMQSTTGLLDDFKAYLIIHRPIQSLAQDFKKFKGYPSNISAVLNTLSGYTEVEYIHLTGIDGATDTELQEIETLLKNGVII